VNAGTGGPRSDRVFFAAAIVVAGALKAHYSVAGAEGLRWILAPTTALVGAATSTSFIFEPRHGYLSPELDLLIAPVCAGLNFLIVAFCSAAFGLLPLVRGRVRKAAFFVGALAVGYGLTVVVNAGRILLGLRLRGAAGPFGWIGWMTPADVHRAMGVLVYLSALFGTFLVARWRLLLHLPKSGRGRA
jgi:exosortase K